MKKLCCKAEVVSVKNWIILSALFIGFMIASFYFADNIESLIISCILVLIFISVFTATNIQEMIRNKEETKNYQKIKTNGIKTDGKILKCLYNCDEFGAEISEVGIQKIYRLLVEYKDPKTKKIKTFYTPPLNFDPKKELGSKKCTVYIYQEELYITDFIRKTNKEQKINFDN